MRQSKAAMLAGIDPDAAMVYGPRVDEILDDALIKIDADFKTQRVAAQKATSDLAIRELSDSLKAAANSGDQAEVANLLTLVSSARAAQVDMGLVSIEESARQTQAELDDVNIYGAIGSWRGPDGRLIHSKILNAVENPVEGLSPEQNKAAVDMAMNEYTMLATKEKAENTAAAAAKKQADKDASAEKNLGYLPDSEWQTKIWNLYDDYMKNRRNQVYNDPAMITQMNIAAFNGTLPLETINARRMQSLETGTGIDDAEHLRLLNLVTSMQEAESVAGEKGMDEDFREARNVLNLAMGLNPQGFQIPGLTKPGKSAEKSASMREYLRLVKEMGEDPYVAAQKVIADYDWIEYHKKEDQIKHNDILEFQRVDSAMPDYQTFAKEFEGKRDMLAQRLEKGEISRREYRETLIQWNDILSLPSDVWNSAPPEEQEFGAEK
jgi:hypothetical protein